MQEDELRKAFQKIKVDVESLESGLSSIKEALLIQNEVLSNLLKRVYSLEPKMEKKEENPDSTRNYGVNQSINHLSTQKENKKIVPENIDFNDKISVSIGNEGVKERLSHVIFENKGIFSEEIKNKGQNNVLRLAKIKIDETFNNLSKQELKVFLTIYQLEEDHQETSYRVIAERMDLSEHCIRAHICSLFRKKAPLYKMKLNNRITLLFVDKDFKSLNLKQKLISLYYKVDPQQSTLFDIYR